MRKTLFLLFALALAYPAAAHADTITFSVSVVASGFAGFTPFIDERVTFAQTAPADLVNEAVMDSGGTPSSFAICFDSGSTVTIQSLGTGGGPELTCVLHNFGTGPFLIVDGNGGLSITVPLNFDSFQSSVGPVAGIADSNFNNGCDPEVNEPCPPNFAGVMLTSIEPDTGIAAMIVTSPTPEPSTFVLLATGTLGVGCLLRRRRSSNA